MKLQSLTATPLMMNTWLNDEHVVSHHTSVRTVQSPTAALTEPARSVRAPYNAAGSDASMYATARAMSLIDHQHAVVRKSLAARQIRAQVTSHELQGFNEERNSQSRPHKDR